jgi:monoamine oxidase
MSPGTWSTLGEALTEPVGPIHWAGTETASVWNGYIDGAIASGRRAADEIVTALPGQPEQDG